MSLQWTFIAVFLYSEVALVALLMIPFISASRWQKIFKSRLLTGLAYYSNIYFNILIAILVLLFLDAIREVIKYSDVPTEVDMKNNPQAETAIHMRLFRAQRNLYIAGFALFLWPVLRRLVTLTSQQATLQAQTDAALRQAQSASDMAKKLMEDQENKVNEKGETEEKTDYEDKITNLEMKIKEKNKEIDFGKEEIDNLKQVLESTQKNFDAMKKQAEATNSEYDRLLEEHATLQKHVMYLSDVDVDANAVLRDEKEVAAGGDDKKDN